MASLTCPTCGRDNPDFLDDCQFCQTPLRREATLNTGDTPTKKSTGELEQALPDWLQDARKQAKDSAEEEAAKEATRSKPQKEEPDLLAGLAFQAAADEEEVPDWLSAINPLDQQTPASSKSMMGTAKDKDQPSDFFAQFDASKSEGFDFEPTLPVPGPDEAARDELPPWLSANAAEPQTGAPQKDELSDWFSSAESNRPVDSDESQGSKLHNLTAPFSQDFDSAHGGPTTSGASEDLSWLRELEASSQGAEPSAPETSPADLDWISNLDSASGSQEDLSWLKDLGGTPAPTSQPEAQPEDLSWLSNLGGTPLPPEPAAGAAPAREEDLDWLNALGGTTPAPAAPTEPAKEDLSWLANLGGTPVEPPSSAPSSTGDDLSWLKDFAGTAEPSASEPAPAQDNLDWLKDLGGTPPMTAGEPPTSGPAPAADDLSWLNALGGTPAPTFEQPSASQEDLSWLENLGSASAEPSQEASPFAETDVPDWLKDMEARQSIGPAQTPQFTPARTAPLREDALPEMPDWLKSATESSQAPSLPPLSAIPSSRPAGKRRLLDETPRQAAGLQAPEQAQGEPAEEGEFSIPAESTLANQDVDALFAVEMPDWLTQPETAQTETLDEQAEAIPAGAADELAPVELPSWVQAMRPVEAMMGEAAAIATDQRPEREGPLAGLRGVIPFAPIGSAQRPRALSLKLQATAEQQAGASLVEQIIASEATAQALQVSPFISSQRALRWGLAILFWLVLGVVIGFGTQTMPISSALPVPEVSNISNVVLNLPSGVPVLVVMDYEPSLAGEMEAASGPLLDHLVVSRKPVFTFVATSPNGTGLVDRLLANTKISRPAPEGGLDYQAGTHYINAGYLPGGLAGVRGFTEDPTRVMPSLIGKVDKFSSYQSVIIITDQAEAGQMWIEQLTLAKQSDPLLAGQQVLVVASGQAGPILRPYISSQQVAGMLSGMPDAARYEYVNNSRPGTVRSYWDAFAAGLFLAIVSIVVGSLWSLVSGIRARRAEAEPG